jgi:hypothetical protein
MADPVNRIIPSTVAPERYPVSRRERDERNKKEPQQKAAGKPKASPVASADTTPSGEHDDGIASNNDAVKGKILDISA